jgi:predicted MFS family arabinose efflux permease
LGAVNFAGYLVGAAAAPWVSRRLGMRWALRLSMLVASLCFGLCAVRGDLTWFVPWRALAGIAGGVLMVLAGPAVQAVVPPSMHGVAAGAVFAGPGSGIVVGAVIVPALLRAGFPAAWLALAATGLLLAALSWTRWPNVPPPPQTHLPRLQSDTGRLVAVYALSAAAATPHMVWWPDFIARGLGRGATAGATFWLLYGAAAAFGPLIFGRLADRAGTPRAISGALLVQATGVAMPLASGAMILLVLSTVLSAATAIGLTGLALTRARELAGNEAPGVWRISTVAWAAAQTGTGFVLAWLYATTESHQALFALGLVAALAAIPLARR